MKSLPRAAFHAAFVGEAHQIARVYAQSRRQQIEDLANCAPGVFTATDLAQLTEVEVLFSTWGMPVLNAAQLDQLPNLRAVFYAAGSGQNFARPLPTEIRGHDGDAGIDGVITGICSLFR